MTVAQIEAGTLTANRQDRTVSGLLLKFGEVGRTNLGRFKVGKGVFRLPADVPSFLHLVDSHARPVKPVGTALFAQETEEGIIAGWRINDGPEGDALLAAWDSGDQNVPRKLSIEVDDVKLRGGQAVQGVVHGAALVKAGAFPSSSLMAEDTPDVEPVQPDDDDADTAVETKTNPDGSQTVTITSTKNETAADGTVTVLKTVTTQTIEKPAEEPDPTEQEPTVPAATPPSTLNATRKPKEASAQTVFAAIQAAFDGRASGDQNTLLAALSDIKTAGTGALPAEGVVQPAWLGEVWENRAYERKFWSMVKNGTLTNQDEKGWKLDQGTALVQPYAGNKANVPTGTGSTSLVGSVFQRWAVAVDIAREFYDIPGNREVIEAFVKGIFNSYAKVTDEWALGQFIAAAGAQIDADTYPTQYNRSIGKVLQVLDIINDSDVDATSIVVAQDVFKELMYTPKDLIPEYISLSFGTKGEGTGDGVFIVRDKFKKLGTGQVLGVAKEAAHLNELGGSPLTVDALDIARGGMDKGTHGYTQYMTEYDDGLVLLGDKAA